MEASAHGLHYDRFLALEYLRAARGETGESWAERCLAALLLENQVIRIPADDLDAFDDLCIALGLKTCSGLGEPLAELILEDGYSSRDLALFVPELLSRLMRLIRIHLPLMVNPLEPSVWRSFVRVANEMPKLTLARYLFRPEETAQEIVSRLRVTRGSEDSLSRLGLQPAAYWSSSPTSMPAFEKDVLGRLCAPRSIYWKSSQCARELNALVEYPLESAAVTIKLPGGDGEFEIKRAGAADGRALSVITERNGKYAPTSHRLFGGSLGWLAQREAVAGGIFGRIYSLVHGEQSPCCRTVQLNSIVTVPGADGEVHVLDYLTDENAYGLGFESMRAAMEVCVQSFPSDTAVRQSRYDGEEGLTLKFIAQAVPMQAILSGTSSFRLDRLAGYLSADGAEQYFRIGLGRDYGVEDARWLADTVVEEILGEVMVPAGEFANYGAYLDEVFRQPANRRSADKNFLEVMRQIGKMWGTLLAVRGFSDGESFVLRNAGLRSVWNKGEWRIRILFMDHDDLTVAGSRYTYLWPWREASGMSFDCVHILGGQLGDTSIPGEVGALQQIYRVSEETLWLGSDALKRATKYAYDATQNALTTSPELRSLFQQNFLCGYRDFDELLPTLLSCGSDDHDHWRQMAAPILREKGYDEELTAEYLRALVHFRSFFERVSFLYSR